MCHSLLHRVDKCFVPSDSLNKAARDRGVTPEHITQYGLPIRRGFWADRSSSPSKKPAASTNMFEDFFASFGGGGGEQSSASIKASGAKSKLQDYFYFC